MTFLNSQCAVLRRESIFFPAILRSTDRWCLLLRRCRGGVALVLVGPVVCCHLLLFGMCVCVCVCGYILQSYEQLDVGIVERELTERLQQLNQKLTAAVAAPSVRDRGGRG